MLTRIEYLVTYVAAGSLSSERKEQVRLGNLCVNAMCFELTLRFCLLAMYRIIMLKLLDTRI